MSSEASGRTALANGLTEGCLPASDHHAGDGATTNALAIVIISGRQQAVIPEAIAYRERLRSVRVDNIHNEPFSPQSRVAREDNLGSAVFLNGRDAVQFLIDQGIDEARGDIELRGWRRLMARFFLTPLQRAIKETLTYDADDHAELAQYNERFDHYLALHGETDLSGEAVQRIDVSHPEPHEAPTRCRVCGRPGSVITIAPLSGALSSRASGHYCHKHGLMLAGLDGEGRVIHLGEAAR